MGSRRRRHEAQDVQGSGWLSPPKFCLVLFPSPDDKQFGDTWCLFPCPALLAIMCISPSRKLHEIDETRSSNAACGLSDKPRPSYASTNVHSAPILAFPIQRRPTSPANQQTSKCSSLFIRASRQTHRNFSALHLHLHCHSLLFVYILRHHSNPKHMQAPPLLHKLFHSFQHSPMKPPISNN